MSRIGWASVRSTSLRRDLVSQRSMEGFMCTPMKVLPSTVGSARFTSIRGDCVDRLCPCRRDRVMASSRSVEGSVFLGEGLGVAVDLFLEKASRKGRRMVRVRRKDS